MNTETSCALVRLCPLFGQNTSMAVGPMSALVIGPCETVGREEVAGMSCCSCGLCY